MLSAFRGKQRRHRGASWRHVARLADLLAAQPRPILTWTPISTFDVVRCAESMVGARGLRLCRPALDALDSDDWDGPAAGASECQRGQRTTSCWRSASAGAHRRRVLALFDGERSGSAWGQIHGRQIRASDGNPFSPHVPWRGVEQARKARLAAWHHFGEGQHGLRFTRRRRRGGTAPAAEPTRATATRSG